MVILVPGGNGGIVALSLAVLCAPAARGEGPDPLAPLDSAISAAEDRLRAADLEGAETRYREALFEGWMLTATLEKLERRVPEAREALRNASLFRVESPEGLRALGAAQLQMGDAAAATETLQALAAKDPRDGEATRILARALSAGGQAEAAAQKLAEVEALAAGDDELAFLVATDYLWLKRPAEAERLFARVLRARPLPQTHVLIGRAYRDAGEYDRARAELQAALARDATVRRAHYYLGMVALADARVGPDRLDRAIAEFREELASVGEPRFLVCEGDLDNVLGIVYVEEGLCRHGVHACLSLDVTPAAGYRFLRVIIELRDIASRRGRLEMIGTIAHELWHAVEVLAERGLRTTAAIYQFYARETPTSNRSFETQAAISIGAKVRREAGPRLNSVVNRGWRAQCAGPDNFFGEGWWAWPCV